jgi:amino acid adenylation domain-containing protein
METRDGMNGGPPATEPQRPSAHMPSEPLAIVGIGCRFPGGVDDWRSFWELLEEGRDAVVETPEDRWSRRKFYRSGKARPGKTQSRWGGHVSGLDDFDPQFFGISPREAAGMDPQQRMLLEVAWRAIEDSGRDARGLAGQPVAVFVGISSFDQAVATLSLQDRGVLDAYSNTGGSSSIAANRISYCFDLRGPSVAVDTACSSSLVAVHLACESIHRGESRMALAGGVNALLMPDFSVAFSQLGVLSPDGRCKTFDSRANGYVRSEGAGMVLIKPLADAVRDGDLVYAVIRATALNQDGRTPGLTVPSQAAQEALVREACRRAGVDPADVQYVEAHGTGTPVGDPIEANALGAVLSVGRPVDRPCWIGSVKTNIGHMEAAAGIASVIKVSLALHHRRIPAHLHFLEANPAIDFERLKLRVPTSSVPWPDATPRIAGINGFGYGGANAHVLMAEPPALADVTAAARTESTPVLVPLSGRNRRGVAALAGRLADTLADGADPWFAGVALGDIAAFMAHYRSADDTRAAVVATDREDLVAKLRALAGAAVSDGMAGREPALQSAEIAFVFSGQGPQWWGMGRRLLAESRVFRSVIERCDTAFSRLGSWSLVEELSRDESTSRIKETSIAQPSIFAIQAGLAAVWNDWGIRPALCVGHSVGEIAAAHAAGVLSFEEACLVAYHRGRTMDLASSHGAMIAVGLSATELEPWLAGCDRHVSIAAVNGPTSLTLSGCGSVIEGLANRFEAAGVFCRRLAVEYAFHSPLMDPVRGALLASLAAVQPQEATVPFISTVTGQACHGRQLDGEYWWRNVRQPVLFADAMRCLAERGIRLALEIGPHPVLTYAINECFHAAGRSVEALPSLHRDRDDMECLLGSLGRLHGLGLDVDWKRIHRRPSHRLAIPPQPFHLQRLHGESRESRESRYAADCHPLLGEAADGPTPRWQCRIDLRVQSYLRDHLVRGVCLHPAAGFVEAAIAASRRLAGPEVATIRLQRLLLHKACIHAEESPRWMECHYRPDRRSLTFSERGVDGGDWSELATVRVASDADPAPWPTESLAAVRSRCTEPFDRRRLYDYCLRLGLAYGEQFQGIVSGVRRSGESLGEVVLDPRLDEEEEMEEYFIHPALLDSCFHAMIAADCDFDHAVPGLYLPHEIREIRFHARPGGRATVHARIVSRIGDHMEADLDIFDGHGRPCLSIRGFVSHRVAGSNPTESVADLIYRLDWVRQELTPEGAITDGMTTPGVAAVPSAPPEAAGHWLVLCDDGGFGGTLAQALAAAGDSVTLVHRGAGFATRHGGGFTVDPDERGDFVRLFETMRDRCPGGLTGLVYLWGLDVAPIGGVTTDALEASVLLTCRGPLHMLQAWEQAGPAAAVPCFIVTSAAQAAEGPPGRVAVAQTPLIGMGRVMASEYGRWRTRLIDLSAEAIPELPALIAELRRNNGEDEVLLRRGERWVRRFHPHRHLPACPAAVATLPSRLEAAASAGIEDLGYRLYQPAALRAGEVEIAARAAGLNFSDVMKALDLYPGLPPGPVFLGSECSGTITRVGPGVTQWQVGDEVMAVAPGAFGTHVVVRESLVARKPRTLSHEQAAAIPIAFLTAAHALDECGRIRAGESVLIHAASGGVGLAAIQIAKLAGARILATAGSDEKREFVRRRGADHVMDSRSLAFADEARRFTGGGLDMVLNSLPGEAIPRGVAALATGGRFLEIGKRDIYADAAIGLHAFRNNIAFFAIDLDQLFKQQPERMGSLLRTLPERFESGALEPLPVTVHPADDTVGAFRSMQQARHIGKIVISYADRPVAVRPAEDGSVGCDRAGTYWVAGGLGGFGLEVARWLAAQGAGTLVLGGRSDTVPAAAAAVIAEIERGGTRVCLMPADITRAEEVRRVLDRIGAELPPLKGIFHTAMVLEDRLLVDLDDATLDRVLRPKLLGGWNLHQESAHFPLDHFVLFSSLSSIFGHAGQANYAAANAALDGLVHERRALGLPGTVINWGHLGEVGYLARRDDLSARLERQGVLSFTVRQATDCLAYAISSQEPQLSVLRMDWTLWRGLGITDNVAPKFAHLLRSTVGGGDASGLAVLSPAAIVSASPAERRPLVQRAVCSKAAALLGIGVAELDASRPLLELGLDSLMAVELRNWIESQVGVGLPISALMRSAGIDPLVDAICAAMRMEEAGPVAAVSAATGTLSEPEFPMSAGQRGLWYAYRRDPDSTPYNVFLPTRVRSPLDVDAMRRTMELIVERHASLRTTFSDDGGHLLQHVHASLPPEFTTVDACGRDIDDLRDELMADAARPFHLEQGPLLRVSVYRVAADDWLILATTHHIVVDFWSLIVILDEVGRIYPRVVAGDDPGLPAASGNYAEFVRRQDALLANEWGGVLQRYWAGQLDGLPSVVELPTDHVRPRSFTGRADTVALGLSADVVAGITRLAAAERVTTSAVVLAALQVLVSRYTGRTSFVIGTPFSGRSEQRFERTVGFFVNMLPIPARLDDTPTFAELVRRVGATLIGALEHEDYPLASIVQDVGPDRDPSRSPLIQVSCTFEKSQLREESGRAGFLFPDRAEVAMLGGLRQESFHVPQQTCLYDAEFIFEQTDDSLRGMICFCRDLFTVDSMRRMARNFESLLGALVRAERTPIEQIPWPESETSPAVVASRLPAAKPQTVVDLLMPVIERSPRRLAIVEGREHWDYGQLGELCRGMAAELAGAGVREGCLVPVVGHGAGAFLGTVATMLSGAAAVPIDSRQPAVAWSTLLEDTAASVAVVAGGGEWLDAATAMNKAAIRRIDVHAVRESGATYMHDAVPQPEGLAYCIYTSGSTGRPKGVLIEHRAIVNTLVWRRQAVPLGKNDRVLMLLSPQFDAALGITLATLSQGGTLVMADETAKSDVSLLIDQVIRDRITVLPAVPALLQLMATHPRFPECESLRQMWAGGEAMPPELPTLVSRLPGVQLWNFYGPTEAAVEAAACPVIAAADGPYAGRELTRRVPIGSPVTNMTLMVLDEARRPVPDTVPGELAIAGPGLARGYLGRPDLTTSRFTSLGGGAGSRIYLTGDRCRRLADGQYEYLGRLDDQVKLRGYRIELGEVESCLLQHPAVAGVAAKVISPETPQARLAAFVVPGKHARPANEEDANALAADIRSWAAERIAVYKVPAAVVLVDSLPLLAGGKIDRKRLPDTLSVDVGDAVHMPPVTPLERHLADMWRQVLGIANVGVHQNFFDLGGTSLQAAMLTAGLSEHLGVHVPTALLFDLADIAQIARRLVLLHRAEMEDRFGSESVTAYDHETAGNGAGLATSVCHPLLVPLKSGGDRAPIFMIHPPGGVVVCYRELARLIDPARPLFGVRSRGLHGEEQMPESLESMAADYVDAIRTRQPEGPYLLGGWSLGGVMACEVARQLVAAGEVVERLLLLDSALPEAALPTGGVGAGGRAGLEYGLDVDLEGLSRMSPEEQLPFLWQHARQLGLLDERTPEQLVTRVLADLKSLFAHHVTLCERYRPRPLPIDAVLYRPREVPFDVGGPEDRGWGHFMRTVKVCMVAGHHHSMVALPHVRELADAINGSLVPASQQEAGESSRFFPRPECALNEYAGPR